MVSQPQKPNSRSEPLFLAELEAPKPHDATPVYEMGGESAYAEGGGAAHKKIPGRDETDVPAALAINFGGHRPGGSASGGAQSPVNEPVTSLDTETFIPAPLKISRPRQTSQGPTSPKVFKPYQPSAALEEPKLPSNAGHGKHEGGWAYKPYRRPSYHEPQAAAPAFASSAAVVSGSAPSTPAPAAQLFRLPSPTGDEQQALAAFPPGSPARPPLASPPVPGTRTPSPSAGPPHPAYNDHQAHDQAAMPPPPPVPLKTRPSAVETGVHRQSEADGGQQSLAARPAEGFHAIPSSPPVPPKTTVAEQPAEIVLWPHPSTPGPGPLAGQSSSIEPPAKGSSPVPTQQPTQAPASTAPAIPEPVNSGPETIAPPSGPPPKAAKHEPQPQHQGQQSVTTPQAAHASSSSSQAARPSEKSSMFPQFPEADQSTPSDPPPPYMPSATHGPGSYSVPSEKPSLFPPPPQTTSQLPRPDAASQSQPSSPLPSLHSQYGQPFSQPPQSPGAQSNHHSQTQPGAGPSSQAPFSPQDECLPPPGPPPSSQYAFTPLPGSTYHVLQPPPPLPPRPSTAHTYSTPGLNSNTVNAAAYPPPPKTNYVAHGPAAVMPQSSSSSTSNPHRPSGGKLFGSSVAKKWLDKTSQVLENKVEELLQNHPDPKYRPQTKAGHGSQQQQYAPQQHYGSHGGPSTPQPQYHPPQ